MEVPTDDDATLTSVRRVMAPDNNHTGLHQGTVQPTTLGRTTAQGSYDSVNSSTGGLSTSSWRLSQNRNFNSNGTGMSSGGYQPRGGLYNIHGSRSSGAGIWMDEEKSDKILGAAMAKTTGPGLLRTASSSDYDTDGDLSKASRQSARMLDGPSHSQVTDVNEFFSNSRFSQPPNRNALHSLQHVHGQHNSNTNNRRIDDDERTFDYGDRDDDSTGSASYARRHRKEAERRVRLGGDTEEDKEEEQDMSNNGSKGKTSSESGVPPLLSKEDLEQYRKSMENPAMRLGAGVVGVATVGCIAWGPVGLLVGVAAVGLGFGIMQIPEEERNKIQEKAEKAVHDFHEKAVDMSESLSSSCMNTYKDSGVADHLPHCLSGTDGVDKDLDSTRSERLGNAGGTVDAVQPVQQRSPVPNHHSATSVGPAIEQPPSVPMKHHKDRFRNKKVACLRNVRIMPVAQIYGLDPSAQPRAWLDIVASANTSHQQKNEGMEEIILLAKDKRRAKIFLDEGILDSIIWTLSRYFEKLEVVGKHTDWAFPEISPSEKIAAVLAAQCCMTLGKAHCAAIHTEGDLQLMSMYERGTVPEERQVAQMLHEIPHHTRITKTNDPTIVEPSKEVFALRQLTLPQAEELAKSIKDVADGKL
jgi:hypothetical protein